MSRRSLWGYPLSSRKAGLAYWSGGRSVGLIFNLTDSGFRLRLVALRSGRSAQQPLGADVFVNFWPVDTVAASGNLPMVQVADWPLESPARLAMSVNVNRNHHLRSSA
jgi:hypothetical protein